MLDAVSLLGIRLQLLLGRPKVPLPAPYEVMEALLGLNVTNNDRERDGFQLEFSLGRDSPLEYGLLRSGILDVPNRVIIVAIFGARPQVLIDGLITDLQVIPSNQPGRSTLEVTGEDLSLELGFEDQSETHPNQSDSTIVQKLLAGAGFIPQVTPTSDTPSLNDRLPTQQSTNLAFIRRLARRNGFVFYVEPTDVPGVNLAYWGPEQRQGAPQAPLKMNMGPETNVDTPINFHYRGLEPAEPEVNILEPFSRQTIPVPAPSGLLPSLSGQPARPLRKVKARDAANLSFAQALQRAIQGSTGAAETLEATGEVDAVRYGRALRARRLVEVCGAGQSYDGTYYVKQVIHQIRRFPRPTYRMQFTLIREGRGATRSTLTPGAGET